MHPDRGSEDGLSLYNTGSRGIVGDTLKTRKVPSQNRFGAIYRTTIRDENRLQLQKDLARSHNVGKLSGECMFPAPSTPPAPSRGNVQGY